METDSKTPTDEIFKQLNNDDKDHAERIRTYMRDNNISLDGEDQA
jgi:hypothetical protein